MSKSSSAQSPIPSVVDSEDSHSITSDSLTETPLTVTEHSKTMADDSRAFGTPLQQFVQKLTSVMAKYGLDNKLTDGNFPEWSLEIKRVLRTIDYHKYLTVSDFKAPSLTDDQHLKVKLVISIWLLGLMDNHNKTRCQTMLKLRNSGSDDDEDDVSVEEDDDDIAYEPSLIWTFLKNHHQKISEAGLQTIEDTLNDMKILSTDSFKVHCDKFNNLVADFFKYKGRMSSSSAARKLIKTVKTRINENASENIYNKVVPLTREGVVQYLIDYEARNSGFTTPAIVEASHSGYNAAAAHSGGGYQRRVKPRCTEHKCISTTHDSEKCFAKPKNKAARDLWISQMEAKRNRSQPTSTVSGVKQVSLPSASVAAATTGPFASLHFSWDLDAPVEPSASATVNLPFETSHTVFDDDSPAANVVSNSGNLWALYDTCATHYMFNNDSLFSSSSLTRVQDSSKRLKLAGGDASLAVHSTGTVQLKSGSGKQFDLNNSLFVPELSQNLLAGGVMLKKGVEVFIHPNNSNCFSLIFKGEALFNGVFAANSLMYVALEPVSQITVLAASSTSTEDLSHLLHRRLGHLSSRYLKMMGKHGSVDGLSENLPAVVDCETCSLSKNHKIPHSSTRPRASSHLKNVHVDLSGIIRTKGLSNEMYYALFCDDFSSYRHIFFMKDKSKETVFDVFKDYIALSERQTCKMLKQFTIDRGGEFVNDLLGSELRNKGIVLHLTAAHSPEENGVSERGNRTISTKARSLMIEVNVPLRFWVQACRTAVFLTNRTMTSALSEKRTPFEAWHYRKPSVDHLRVFGCLAYSLIRKELRGSKFGPVSSRGVLLGFEEDNFNYLIFDLDSQKLLVTHHATFNEGIFPFIDQDKTVAHPPTHEPPVNEPVNVQFFDDDSDDEPPGEENPFPVVSIESESPALNIQSGPPGVLPEPSSLTDTAPPEPRRSGRSVRPVTYTAISIGGCGGEPALSASWELGDMLDCVLPECNLVTSSLEAPRSFVKAINGHEGEKWLEACKKEVKALRDKNVWKLVDRPKSSNVIRGLWLFRKKPTSDPQNPIKFKSRYVAMGNTQVEGEDYFEPFAPTGKPTSLRIIVAIAATFGWEVHQMDAVTAFLNSDLFETIYVEQPEGFKEPGEEDKVCLLLKSLYGPKQAQNVGKTT